MHTLADGIGRAAQFSGPCHVACSGAGNVYVADRGNRCIRKISVEPGCCTVTTLAGDGTAGYRDGAGAQAQFDFPFGIAVDGDGNVLVTEDGDRRNFGHRVRMVTPTGATSTLAGSGEMGYADGQGVAAEFYCPAGIAADAAGDVLVASFGNGSIRHIAAGLTPPASLRAPELDTPTPDALVLADYGTLLGNGEDTHHTVEFLVVGELIRAHKSILAARCEYFKPMFGSGFAEGAMGGGGAASSGVVATSPLPVEDTTPEAFRALLRFLYMGAVELAEDTVLDVASLSQCYLVTALQEQCTEHCKSNISLTNAVPWLVAADTHGMASLRATLFEYVVPNLDAIEVAVPDTRAILESRPTLLCDLAKAAMSPPVAKRRKTGN